jgi:mannosyltransferase
MEWAIMSRPTVSRLGPVLGPGLLMLTLGLVGAGRPVLSWDEIATADVARRTPGQIWLLTQHVDGVFAPYYFLSHYWTALAGNSPVDLRLPSIVAMAGAAALVGALGSRYYGPGTGALAGILFCLVPNASRYAAEARPYAFACFFSLLALLLLHRALDRPGPARWILYAVAVVFVGLSHLIALTTLSAHVVAVWRHGSRRTVKGWTASAGPALLALAPVFWLGVQQRGEQLSWVPPLSTGVLWKFPGEVVGSEASGWLLLGFAVLGLCRPLPHRAALAALAGGPIVTVGAVWLVVAPYWVPRYLLIVLAPLVLLAAAGLRDVLSVSRRPVPARIPRTRSVMPVAPSPALVGARSRPAFTAPPTPVSVLVQARRSVAPLAQMAAVLALLTVAVYPAQRAVRGFHAKTGSDYRTAAALVARYQLPGDAIVYSANSRTMRAGLTYYLEHGPQDVLLARTAAAAGRLLASEFPPASGRLAATSRLWLLVYGVHQDPLSARSDLRTVLSGHFHLDRIWFPQHETLALYIRDR